MGYLQQDIRDGVAEGLESLESRNWHSSQKLM